MAYSSIPDSWRDIGKAVKKELVDLIHTNLEDLDGRVTSVEGSVSTTIIVNEKVVKERDNQPLGTIVWSPLALAAFQAEAADGGWLLCDGGSCAGSDYETLMTRSVVPDLRGRFIRMKDHGAGRNPDGDVATDVAQAEATKTHGHANTFALGSATVAGSAHQHNFAHTHQVMWENNDGTGLFFNSSNSDSITSWTDGTDGGSLVIQDNDDVADGGAGTVRTFINTSSNFYYTSGVINAPGGSGSSAVTGNNDDTTTVTLSGAVTDYTGATETRPVNVTENAFIKVNRNYITARTGYFLWRAPQALTINQVIVSPVLQGTSGTLTIDIMKGDVTTQATSIFTALPDMAYNDTTAQTGTLNATNAEIAAGDYLRVDITTTQAKLKEFHILIAAAPA